MKLPKLVLIFFCILISSGVYAQHDTHVPISTIPIKLPKKKGKKNTTATKDTVKVKEEEADQKDITDVFAQVFKKKVTPTVDSVTSKPSFTIVPAIGYTLVTKLAIVVSGNVVFRTGPQSKISTIVASTSFTQNKQFTLPIQSSIWSKDNDYNFVGDFRYYKYPLSTFGLGSSSNINYEDPMDYNYLRIYETVLKHIGGNFYAGAGYIIDNHWNIADNGSYGYYAAYGGGSRSIASGITINGLLDSRDNTINPFKGSYATLQYRDNFAFLGSTSSWRSLTLDFRTYINFPAGTNNVLALWSFNWLTLGGKPGYLELPSTQWDAASATGRGYIQGRFSGTQMVYGEAEYRCRITRNGLLGGVFFLNAQSLSAEPGTRLQGIQPGWGPGLRIKLNKLSKTNISIDYGFGRQGSNGLFVDVGEIF
ncbi:MAG TPA: BamA/TamA family outer membrane protein [Mucilaginibacter sp.]|jgi:hypothetical protein